MKIYWLDDKHNSGIGWYGASDTSRLHGGNFNPDFAVRMEFIDCITPSFMNYNCAGGKYKLKNKSHKSLKDCLDYVEKEYNKLRMAQER